MTLRERFGWDASTTAVVFDSQSLKSEEEAARRRRGYDTAKK
jgi:hypothetical protein